MKAYVRVDIYIHIFVTSVVGGEWSASCSHRFTAGTHWIGGWVGPRAGLDDVEKRKFFTLSGLELQPLSCPAYSWSLYQLRYPGSQHFHITKIILGSRKISLWNCPAPALVPQSVAAPDAADSHKVHSLEQNCLLGCDAASCNRLINVSEESVATIFAVKECSFTWIQVHMFLVLHIKYPCCSYFNGCKKVHF
jgi:hypothetical protein